MHNGAAVTGFIFTGAYTASGCLCIHGHAKICITMHMICERSPCLLHGLLVWLMIIRLASGKYNLYTQQIVATM